MTNRGSGHRYTRRKILRRLGLATGALTLPALVRSLKPLTAPDASAEMIQPRMPLPSPVTVAAAAANNPHRVVLVKTEDRVAGTQRAIELLQPSGVSGKTVFIKPNYNTGDTAPAATDPSVLETLIQEFQAAGASQISIGDRSGMADTRQAMQRKRAFATC